MTTRELIAKLQALPEQDKEIYVAVNTQTTRFAPAQVTPWEVSQAYGGCISVTLPEGMYIGKRKAA